MHQLRIFVTDPSGQEHEHLHRSSPILLGRLPTCEVQLADERASRIHVHLSWEGDTLIVRDMGSGNSTIAILENGREREVVRAHPLPVPTGEVELKLGDTLVHVRLERLFVSFVPSAVVSTACAASTRLHDALTLAESAVTTSDGNPGHSRHVVESIAQSVQALQQALRTDLPDQATVRWSRTVDDARSALLRWSFEVMRSLTYVAGQLESGPPPSPASPDELLAKLGDSLPSWLTEDAEGAPTLRAPEPSVGRFQFSERQAADGTTYLVGAPRKGRQR